MPTAYNVSQAAAVIGASPSTVRNWCKQYAAHLSPGASPQAGAERILTPVDVATLQYIKAQRDAMKDYDTIIAELAVMPVDDAIEPYIDIQATATPPEPLQPPTVATMPSDVLQALQIVVDSRHDALIARIEAMEAKRGDNLQWFVFGIVTGVILIGVVAAIVLAGAWLGR